MTIRHAVGIALLASLLAGCSSNTVQILQPEIRIAQVYSGPDFFYNRGTVWIPYYMEVQNLSGESITLTKVDMRVQSPGAYTITNGITLFDRHIPPGGLEPFEFSVRGFAYGGESEKDIPVTVRIVAQFKSESGTFQKVFSQTFSQSEKNQVRIK